MLLSVGSHLLRRPASGLSCFRGRRRNLLRLCRGDLREDVTLDNGGNVECLHHGYRSGARGRHVFGPYVGGTWRQSVLPSNRVLTYPFMGSRNPHGGEFFRWLVLAKQPGAHIVENGSFESPFHPIARFDAWQSPSSFPVPVTQQELSPVTDVSSDCDRHCVFDVHRKCPSKGRKNQYEHSANDASAPKRATPGQAT